MKNTKETENSKSLYLYTALIFVVALVMIIISFFGQRNLEKINKATMDNKSISEKSAALSEENVRLVEENIQLNSTVESQGDDIEYLNETLTTKNTLITTYETLFSAHTYFVLEDYDKAEEVLLTINIELLDGDSKFLYTQMLTDINERKEDE